MHTPIYYSWEKIFVVFKVYKTYIFSLKIIDKSRIHIKKYFLMMHFTCFFKWVHEACTLRTLSGITYFVSNFTHFVSSTIDFSHFIDLKHGCGFRSKIPTLR